ncbi:hypothetical protein CNMCM6936_002974 [Aspergillus lentulus]|nr:hypothetical protein CNMCM6069_002163 [Aspergillus lentulus]KAF4161821.1 hypothetical protein CNMCM6936_002974 [Aspergillus lentulus]
MTSDAEHPSEITGGCLCASIRYTVHFDGAHKWPPKSGSCQCTMCRKWTASLLPQFLSLAPEQISPAISTSPTYAEYRSSENCLRGFCSKCGSSLLWRNEERPEEIDLFLGTVDEEWLVGERVDSSKSTGNPVGPTRKGGVGKTLGIPKDGQYYYENVITGVTDGLRGGKKYLTHPSQGDGFD